MCSIGDIIVVDRYEQKGMILKHHSFVVIDDCNGNIMGLDFDLIGLVMSSFKNEEQKARKLKYPGNFPVTPEEQDIIGGNNGKSGYIKAEQFYYFRKDSIDFKVIGYLEREVFNLLVKFIQELEVPIEPILDNL